MAEDLEKNWTDIYLFWLLQDNLELYYQGVSALTERRGCAAYFGGGGCYLVSVCSL